MDLTKEQKLDITKTEGEPTPDYFMTVEEILEQVPKGTPANQIVLYFDYDEDRIMVRVLGAPIV